MNSCLRREREIAAILAVTVAVVGGCMHGDHAGRPAGTAADAVERVPVATPFDQDPRLRAIYLESFARAYDLALANSDYAGLGCLCEAGGDPDQYEANVAGFFAGKKAGEAEYARRARSPSFGAPPEP